MSGEKEKFIPQETKAETESFRKPLQLPTDVNYVEPDTLTQLKSGDPKTQILIPITTLPEQIRIANIRTPDGRKINPAGELFDQEKPKITIENDGRVIVEGKTHYLSHVRYNDVLEEYWDETDAVVQARTAMIILSETQPDTVTIVNMTKNNAILMEHYGG